MVVLLENLRDVGVPADVSGNGFPNRNGTAVWVNNFEGSHYRLFVWVLKDVGEEHIKGINLNRMVNNHITLDGNTGIDVVTFWLVYMNVVFFSVIFRIVLGDLLNVTVFWDENCTKVIQIFRVEPLVCIRRTVNISADFEDGLLENTEIFKNVYVTNSFSYDSSITSYFRKIFRSRNSGSENNI